MTATNRNEAPRQARPGDRATKTVRPAWRALVLKAHGQLIQVESLLLSAQAMLSGHCTGLPGGQIPPGTITAAGLTYLLKARDAWSDAVDALDLTADEMAALTAPAIYAVEQRLCECQFELHTMRELLAADPDFGACDLGEALPHVVDLTWFADEHITKVLRVLERAKARTRAPRLREVA